MVDMAYNVDTIHNSSYCDILPVLAFESELRRG